MTTTPRTQPPAPRPTAAPGPDGPLISVTWTDHVTGRQGHLVIDRLVRGVSSGGLRMRAGCTLRRSPGSPAA